MLRIKYKIFKIIGTNLDIFNQQFCNKGLMCLKLRVKGAMCQKFSRRVKCKKKVKNTGGQNEFWK